LVKAYTKRETAPLSQFSKRGLFSLKYSDAIVMRFTSTNRG